jgi:hypothetical protein
MKLRFALPAGSYATVVLGALDVLMAPLGGRGD